MPYNENRPFQGEAWKRPEPPLRKRLYDSVKPHNFTTPGVFDAIQDFRAFCESHGGQPGEIIADGIKKRSGTVDKPKSKNFSYCLFADGLGGWCLNWSSGNGIQHWKSERRTHLSPAEREAIAESIRQGNSRRELANQAKQQAKRIGQLLFSLNETLTIAESLLSGNPDDDRAWYALGIAYRLYPRTEYLHDQLLSRKDGEKREALAMTGRAA